MTDNLFQGQNNSSKRPLKNFSKKSFPLQAVSGVKDEPRIAEHTVTGIIFRDLLTKFGPIEDNWVPRLQRGGKEFSVSDKVEI